MPGITMLGEASKTTFLALEPEKLSIEFEAAAAIKKGQLVKLDATGKVAVWTKADLEKTVLGVAHADAAIGQLVTVHTKGFVLMYALSNANQAAGLATMEAYDAATTVSGTKGYNKASITAIAGEDIGWALDAAGAANLIIRVLVRG